MNVKQISLVRHRYPAVVIHSLADARTVLAIGRPVTLLSAPGAALFAGCLWWRAVIDRAVGEHPATPVADILDCADASGLALSALRCGQRGLVLSATAPGWHAVAEVAASLGGEVSPHRPEAIDMCNRRAVRRLGDWLRADHPGDSGYSVG